MAEKHSNERNVSRALGNAEHLQVVDGIKVRNRLTASTGDGNGR